MSQLSVSPLFDRAVDIPIASLPRIQAPAALPKVLQDAGIGPPRGQSMVVSICRITEDGDVSEVSLSVVSSLSRTKVVVPLTQIFPDAPEGWVMVFNCDLKQFTFAPSTMGSFWVQASRLGLKFYSAYAVGAGANSQTPCTIAEQSTHNLTDFQVRLCIKPWQCHHSCHQKSLAKDLDTRSFSSST